MEEEFQHTYQTELNPEDCINLARSALEQYVKNQKKLDVGSLSDQLYKRAGVVVRLETDKNSRLRGESVLLSTGKRLHHNIVEAVIRAAGEEEYNRAVSSTELNNIKISVAVISSVGITDSPSEELTIGETIPIFHKDKPNIIYPTIPVEQGWDADKYLSMTGKKSGAEPDWWKSASYVPVVEVNIFEEIAPSDGAKAVTDPPHVLK